MATIKNTSTDRDQTARIAGARKCMDALRKFLQDEENGCKEDSHEQRFASELAFVAALGPMPPEQEGAIAALFEFTHHAIDGTVMDCECWTPFSAMTDSERCAEIDRIDAALASDNAECERLAAAKRNVISLIDRRVVQ